MTLCTRCGQTLIPAPKFTHPWKHERTGLLTCFNGQTRDFAAPTTEHAEPDLQEES